MVRRERERLELMNFRKEDCAKGREKELCYICGLGIYPQEMIRKVWRRIGIYNIWFQKSVCHLDCFEVSGNRIGPDVFDSDRGN